MAETRPKMGPKEYVDLYPKASYEKIPVGPIDYGKHVPPDLLDLCAEGVLKMEALSEHKQHVEECVPCRRNFELIFGTPYGRGPGKKSIPDRVLPLRKT